MSNSSRSCPGVSGPGSARIKARTRRATSVTGLRIDRTQLVYTQRGAEQVEPGTIADSLLPAWSSPEKLWDSEAAAIYPPPCQGAQPAQRNTHTTRATAPGPGTHIAETSGLYRAEHHMPGSRGEQVVRQPTNLRRPKVAESELQTSPHCIHQYIGPHPDDKTGQTGPHAGQ